MTARKKHELEGIQYLRGIASIMVVMAHVTAMASFEKYGTPHV
jgi:peptidoglycan/LPS O-acetylase OafA/YrhL